MAEVGLMQRFESKDWKQQMNTDPYQIRSEALERKVVIRADEATQQTRRDFVEEARKNYGVTSAVERCLYTNKIISFGDLFKHYRFEVEHIIPYSICLDNA